LRNNDICQLLKFIFALNPKEQSLRLPAYFNRVFNQKEIIVFLKYHKIAFSSWSILKDPAIVIPKKSGIFDEIRTDYLISYSLNLRYQREAFLILSLFNKASVDVFPLKGTFLAERLYQDIASRCVSADLDLLVKEKDRLRARVILEGYGYKFCPSQEPRELSWSDSYFKEGLPPVDLHWDITMGGRNNKRIEGLWANAKLLDKEGVRYYELMPEELLLFLAANLSSTETTRQLRYLCDILRSITIFNEEIEWDRVLLKAREWKLSGPLYAALNLASAMGLANFPKGIIKKIGLPAGSRIITGILINKRNILSPGLAVRIFDRFFSNFLFEVIVSENMRDYAGFLKRFFYPSLNFNQFTSAFKRIGKGIFKIYRFSLNPKP
jgi:hypothetical protein